MRFDNVESPPRGPTAYGDLRFRTVGDEGAECDGLEIDRDGTVELFDPQCGTRGIGRGEYVIEQRRSGLSTSIQHSCCISCAVKSDAVGTVVMEWEILRLLQSDKGVRLLRRWQDVDRFPTAFSTDVVDDIVDRARRYMARGNRIDAPYGWCRNQLRFITNKLLSNDSIVLIPVADESTYFETLRPEQRRPNTRRAGSHTDTVATAPDSDDEYAGLRALRAGLARFDPDGWEHAAVLALFAVREGSLPGPRCPQPTQGRRADSRSQWAALWYSGQRDLFVLTDGRSPEARRQQISRLARHIREIADRVTAEATGA